MRAMPAKICRSLNSLLLITIVVLFAASLKAQGSQVPPHEQDQRYWRYTVQTTHNGYEASGAAFELAVQVLNAEGAVATSFEGKRDLIASWETRDLKGNLGRSLHDVPTHISCEFHKGICHTHLGLTLTALNELVLLDLGDGPGGLIDAREQGIIVLPTHPRE